MSPGCFCRLFRRNGKRVAPFGFFDGYEDVVAFGVDPLDQIAGGADALHDVELARALAEEDARRLPRPGQDLGAMISRSSCRMSLSAR